ncbi:hypothetical protein CAPTEDRAFT_142796 [Capitella teleta]|uniref:SRCR domain-containing protein n=1 Tax=Capitella teleta TaxID=283909 RepID=R7TZG4_CAPTE|nr:hypothetical protein CAPTEDRAFT_142796 [Capitella teleta]|eukprot:ELT99164.1 hypothetical protein CAPTEDRAFT_142796 [Capitella teleta]
MIIAVGLIVLLASAHGDVPADGSLRLTGGAMETTGNVMVFYQGKWGIVCDDGWSLRAADVVCRSLGYLRALGHTDQAYFGTPNEDVFLDNVRCRGDESSLLECDRNPWHDHDCEKSEAAGVFCAPLPGSLSSPLRVNVSNSTPRITSPHEQHTPTQGPETNSIRMPIRLRGGRNEDEGRVEVRVQGHWGAICGDHWTLLEATVVCKQVGKGHARSAVMSSVFGGEHLAKVLSGIDCMGEEDSLDECSHARRSHDIACPEQDFIAGVVCTHELPDLVPNATLLESSTYLQDKQMYYLTCAMEENCASASAYEIKKTVRDWHIHQRRLMRFSSSTWNFGTADFRPESNKADWEWHLCHMHFHSMEVFAHYDLLDLQHNKVAEGHKASFCLEDVQCLPGKQKKFACKGYGDQGISVGCADDYLHDIDCQWIDITDLKPGTYIFRVHINPNNHVAELSYSNNAVHCDLSYTGLSVTVTNCENGPI